MTVKCIVPVEKFREYVLKPGADQGKIKVFHSLGYRQEHSEQLVEIYRQQATTRYAEGDFRLGKKDIHGQRITIEIILDGVGENIDKVSYIASGWLLQDSSTLRLTTPFAGFTRGN